MDITIQIIIKSKQKQHHNRGMKMFLLKFPGDRNIYTLFPKYLLSFTKLCAAVYELFTCMLFLVQKRQICQENTGLRIICHYAHLNTVCP